MRKTVGYTVIGRVGDRSITKLEFFKDSWGSPRVNGKLRLVANPVSISRGRNVSYSLGGYGAYAPGIPGIGQMGHNSPKGQSAYASAYNTAYARLRGKLRYGGASLGVTLGSYKQSREMIVNRARQVNALTDAYTQRVERFGNRWQRQSIAGLHLEYIFGVKPLIADMYSAANTVIQMAEVVESVRGVKSEGWTEFTQLNDPYYRYILGGNVKVTISTLVRITNPNMWLAERAGLLNPLAVAWDLVPWSFVVNMFVNTGALVNSITDFAGLTFDNESVTYDTQTAGSATGFNTYPSDHPFWASASSVWTSRVKGRTVGSIPKPTLEFKIPDASWELAAIAASLMVQKVTRLDKLISVKLLSK